MMRILLSSILGFFVLYAHGQTRSVSGRLTADSQIFAADCFLKNNAEFGAIADSSGTFHLHFPERVSYDTLVVSAMGFERIEVPLSSLSQSQSLNLHLKAQSILLDEVLIESKRDDLKKFVLNALAKIPKNYPNGSHQLSGLYRKVSTEGSTYTHLEEAAIILQDYAYNNQTSSPQIKTISFRETCDWGKKDSLYVSIFQKVDAELSNQMQIPRSPLSRLYKSNYIRQYNMENTFFNYNTMKKLMEGHFTFEVMDVSVSDGDTIYQIAFAESVTPPAPKSASGRNYLKINGRDLGIIEMHFVRGYQNKGLTDLTHVKFVKNHGRYYPQYIRNVTPRHINKDFGDNEYDIHTFWFDRIVANGFKKLKTKGADDPNDPTSHKVNASDSYSWEASPLIIKYPLEDAIKTDLERHQPLEIQFGKRIKK